MSRSRGRDRGVDVLYVAWRKEGRKGKAHST